MFSGIVEGCVAVTSYELVNGTASIGIDVPIKFDDVKIGDSIAVDGVCLTVTAVNGTNLSFSIIPETLRLTTLGSIEAKSLVNIERSLSVAARIHGHFVSGHVDGTARLISRIEESKQSIRMRFGYPKSLRRFLVKKGSICVAGVSLTLGDITDRYFTVYLAPHTLTVTTLGRMKIGDRANIEVDMIARYLSQIYPAENSTSANLDLKSEPMAAMQYFPKMSDPRTSS